MSIVQRTKTYAICPSCGADAGSVDHLLGQETKTSWYCDSCGKRYGLTFHVSGDVEVYDVPGRKVTTTDLLVLKPQEKPVYFIVEGMRFEGEDSNSDRSEDDHKQFFYESHSCPTNWFKPEMVYFDGDSDPHGLIEYVATIDTATLPPDENYGPNDRDAALVALIERCQERGQMTQQRAQNCPWCGEGTWNGKVCLTCGAKEPKR